MKAAELTLKQILAVRCPTCGATPQERCELTGGQSRTEPHRDRRLTAADDLGKHLLPKHRQESGRAPGRHSGGIRREDM